MVKNRKNNSKIHEAAKKIKVELHRKDKKLEKNEENNLENKKEEGKLDKEKVEEKKEKQTFEIPNPEEPRGVLEGEESRAKRIERIREKIARGELEKIKEESMTKDFSEKILEEDIGFAAPVVSESDSEGRALGVDNLEDVAGSVILPSSRVDENPAYAMNTSVGDYGGNSSYGTSDSYSSGSVGDNSLLISSRTINERRDFDPVGRRVNDSWPRDDMDNRGRRDLDNFKIQERYMAEKEKKKGKLPFE